MTGPGAGRLLRRLAAVETGTGAGVALVRRRCSRLVVGSAGGALARRDVGRELGRETAGVGSRGGAGPLRVRVTDGRRERDDDVLGLRISVGDGRVDTGVEALEVEGAAAAKGTVVVVVVVVVVVAGSAGGGGLRLLAVGLSGGSAVPNVSCVISAF